MIANNSYAVLCTSVLIKHKVVQVCIVLHS